MTNSLLNRTNVSILTNKSGGSVAYGDVVILGSATAKAFTTTTTPGYNDSIIGVVLEPAGIANNAQGKIAVGGWVPQINLDGAATLYDFIATDTVAGQGTPHAAPMAAGDFGVALEASATPEAVLFGMPNGSSTDVDALHLSDTGQLAGLTEETTPATGDLFLMEDGGTGALKYVENDNMPGGGGGESDYSAALAAAYDYMADNNADACDTLINVGAWYTFVYFSSQNAAAWKSATNAVHTVTTAKKLVVIRVIPTADIHLNQANRRARFQNTTDVATVVDYALFTPGDFVWGGDVATPSQFPEVAAGKTVKMEVWNSDTTKRAMGAMLIAKEVDA